MVTRVALSLMHQEDIIILGPKVRTEDLLWAVWNPMALATAKRRHPRDLLLPFLAPAIKKRASLNALGDKSILQLGVAWKTASSYTYDYTYRHTCIHTYMNRYRHILLQQTNG